MTEDSFKEIENVLPCTQDQEILIGKQDNQQQINTDFLQR